MTKFMQFGGVLKLGVALAGLTPIHVLSALSLSYLPNSGLGSQVINYHYGVPMETVMKR
jgi:hypothetical protein